MDLLAILEKKNSLGSIKVALSMHYELYKKKNELKLKK
jgi:hypothetical protein